jgi:hypothetical protein
MRKDSPTTLVENLVSRCDDGSLVVEVVMDDERFSGTESVRHGRDHGLRLLYEAEHPARVSSVHAPFAKLKADDISHPGLDITDPPSLYLRA